MPIKRLGGCGFCNQHNGFRLYIYIYIERERERERKRESLYREDRVSIYSEYIEERLLPYKEESRAGAVGKTRNMVMAMTIATAMVRGVARSMPMAMARGVVMGMDIALGSFGCGYSYG